MLLPSPRQPPPQPPSARQPTSARTPRAGQQQQQQQRQVSGGSVPASPFHHQLLSPRHKKLGHTFGRLMSSRRLAPGSRMSGYLRLHTGTQSQQELPADVEQQPAAADEQQGAAYGTNEQQPNGAAQPAAAAADGAAAAGPPGPKLEAADGSAWQALPPGANGPLDLQEASLWEPPDAATVSRRFPATIYLPVQPPRGRLQAAREWLHRATGFTSEHVALSLQLAVAVAGASSLHVVQESYEALRERTVWIVVTGERHKGFGRGRRQPACWGADHAVPSGCTHVAACPSRTSPEIGAQPACSARFAMPLMQPCACILRLRHGCPPPLFISLSSPRCSGVCAGVHRGRPAAQERASLPGHSQRRPGRHGVSARPPARTCKHGTPPARARKHCTPCVHAAVARPPGGCLGYFAQRHCPGTVPSPCSSQRPRAPSPPCRPPLPRLQLPGPDGAVQRRALHQRPCQVHLHGRVDPAGRLPAHDQPRPLPAPLRCACLLPCLRPPACALLPAVFPHTSCWLVALTYSVPDEGLRGSAPLGGREPLRAPCMQLPVEPA